MARCSIGKNKKRRKFLQDSAPANWEQQGGNLSPLIQESEKISESQWEILENFGKNEAQDSSDVCEYKKTEYREDVPTEETSSPSEGWAQFVSDLLNDVNDAKSKCPVSFGVLEKALLDNPNVAGVLENIRQMAELNRNANAWDRVRHQHMLLARLPFSISYRFLIVDFI